MCANPLCFMQLPLQGASYLLCYNTQGVALGYV